MKWNKLELREFPIEEQDGDNYKTMWYGPIPELGEEVLVTVPLTSGKFIETYVDTWLEFDGIVGDNEIDMNEVEHIAYKRI